MKYDREKEMKYEREKEMKYEREKLMKGESEKHQKASANTSEGTEVYERYVMFIFQVTWLTSII